jgi:hypothetical protein
LAANRRTRRTVPCNFCGREFHPSRASQKFCSPSCLHASLRRAEVQACTHCGQSFTRKPWQMRRPTQDSARFCSRACAAAEHASRRQPTPASPRERVCPNCGVAFSVGGESGRPSRRRYCSSTCAGQARTRKESSAHLLTEEDAAYLAGIIDGAGRIDLYRRGHRVAVRVRVANSSASLAEWLYATTGIGQIHRNRHAKWNWWCSSDSAASLLGQLRPRLVAQAAQVDLALEAQRQVRESPDEGRLLEMRQRIREINSAARPSSLNP